MKHMLSFYICFIILKGCFQHVIRTLDLQTPSCPSVNAYFAATPLFTANMSSAVECALFCLGLQDQCVSVNVKDGMCEVFANDINNDCSKLTAHHQSQYYQSSAMISFAATTAPTPPLLPVSALNWGSAQIVCGALLTLDTEAKQAELEASLISQPGLQLSTASASFAQVWIGGYYEAGLGWVWKPSNTPISAGFSNWRASLYADPPSAGRECLAMQVNSIDFGGWMPYMCNALFNYICQ